MSMFLSAWRVSESYVCAGTGVFRVSVGVNLAVVVCAFLFPKALL